MKLFENIARTYNGYCNLNEDTYHFLQRSAKEEFSIVRETLNEWFSRYPDSEKKEFKNSFQKSFNDRFFELFLHELFLKIGFSIKIHPEISMATSHPDFLISKDGFNLLVEAKIVKGKSNEDERAERRYNQFLEVISRIELKGFGLTIQKLEIKSKHQPRTMDIVNYVKIAVSQLDHNSIRKEIEEAYNFSSPKFIFENDEVYFSFSALPLSFNRSEEIHKGILIHETHTAWGGGEKGLRKAIINKASKYPKGELPFLLCINTLDWKTHSNRDILNTVWGTEAINLKDGVGRGTRRLNGIFFDSNGPKLEHISGVLITKVNPFNITVAEYWLYENPFANYKINFDTLGLSSYHVINDELEMKERRSFENLLS